MMTDAKHRCIIVNMSVRLILLIFICFPLAACGNKTPAPTVHHGQSSGAGSAGVHTVRSGDTLYDLSNRYRLPMRDIVHLNKLRAPFKLFEGQRIKLPPPQEYKVKYGDTLYGVSRVFNVNSTEVARLNDIRAPYVLREGQTLRFPSVIRPVKKSAKPSKINPKISTEVLPAPKGKPKPKKAKVVNIVTPDGVPIPLSKPEHTASHKTTKIAKVQTKAPKRSSSKFLRPVKGKIISKFGVKKSGLHNDGINISAPKGQLVRSAENGVVVYTGNALKGSGNLVLVRHDKQWMTAYAHLDSIAVSKGQTVKRGSTIGKVGSSGSVSKPQLHFEVRRGTSALNPLKYIE